MDFINSPKGLAEWMVCAACAVWIAGLLIDLWRKLTGEPGKPANEDLGRSVERNAEDIKEERHERLREDQMLHGRITELRASVERLRGKIET